jgi:hypothetical protein
MRGPITYANFRENNVRGWAAEFSIVVYYDVVVCLEPTTFPYSFVKHLQCTSTGGQAVQLRKFELNIFNGRHR